MIQDILLYQPTCVFDELNERVVGLLDVLTQDGRDGVRKVAIGIDGTGNAAALFNTAVRQANPRIGSATPPSPLHPTTNCESVRLFQ